MQKTPKTHKTAQNILFCVLITCLGILVSSFSSTVDHMAAAFNQPVSTVGLYLSLFAAGSFASVPFGSVLADWLGKRKIIRIAVGLLAVGVTMISLSGKPVFLYLGLFLMGIGFGPTESMSSALLADENPENSSRWMNLSQIGFGIGAVAAPVAAAGYLSRPGTAYGEVFALCAGLLIVLFAVISFTAPKKPKEKPANKLQPNLFSVLKSRELLIYALMIFCYLGFEAIAPSYIKQFFLAAGESDSFSSLMISLFWASMILCRLIGAFLSGKELRTIKVLSLFTVAGIAVLLLTGERALHVTGVVLFGFGCGSVWPMLVALAARVFPRRSGAACGVMMLFSTAGATVFPAVIGTWVGNIRITFMLCAVLSACVLSGAFLAERAVRSTQIKG